MTPEEIAFENTLIRNWWESVLDGSKASSTFSARWEVTDEDVARAREKGLEIVSYKVPGRSEDEPPIDSICVAQPGKFTDLLSPEDLQRFRDVGLGSRLDKVLAEIGDKSIGQAMVYLEQYERKDEEYDLGPYHAERPEIAALTGIGLGYPACDAAYYVRTNYLGEKPYADEQVDPKWGHALCPEHSRAELQRRQRSDGGH